MPAVRIGMVQGHCLGCCWNPSSSLLPVSVVPVHQREFLHRSKPEEPQAHRRTPEALGGVDRPHTGHSRLSRSANLRTPHAAQLINHSILSPSSCFSFAALLLILFLDLFLS